MSHDLNVDQIKKLWVLDLIIQAGSLRKAALQAKVSPSAVSQTLSSLERSVGKPLLIRQRGLVTPTPDALSILHVVRPAFEAFERLKDLSKIEVPQMSWLNFGTYESLAVDILPGLILRLRETLPQLKLGVRISRTANLLTMIRKGELCSALVTESEDLRRMYVREVTVDHLGFFIARNHPASRSGWEMAEKLGVGSLTPGKQGLPRYFTRFLRQLGPLRPTVLSDSFETLRAAAVAGALVTVLPHRVAYRQDDLVEIFPDGKKDHDRGRHRILMVSMANCDTQEVDFLAQEAQRLLPKRP